MIKRDKVDKVFSDLVRRRSGWKCDCCGTDYSDNHRGLHCSHIFSRRHNNTRWLPQNAVAHCYSCHQRLGENPIDFYAWISEVQSPESLVRLTQRKNQPLRMDKTLKEEIYQYLKKQWENGVIDFDVPDFYKLADFVQKT